MSPSQHESIHNPITPKILSQEQQKHGMYSFTCLHIVNEYFYLKNLNDLEPRLNQHFITPTETFRKVERDTNAGLQMQSDCIYPITLVPYSNDTYQYPCNCSLSTNDKVKSRKVLCAFIHTNKQLSKKTCPLVEFAGTQGFYCHAVL